MRVRLQRPIPFFTHNLCDPALERRTTTACRKKTKKKNAMMHQSPIVDPNQRQMWIQQQQYQQHQQWMAMQQQMMYHHHQQQQQQYMPYQPYQQQSQQPQIQISTEDNQTIWIGDLQPWMEEGYLTNCFAHTGEVCFAKVIRNKHTGQSERYGFVQFASHSAAEKALQSVYGTLMPNTDQPFRLDWATFSAGDRPPDTATYVTIFVGDLAPDVTDAVLHETFVSQYPSVNSAKVVINPSTGRSKGYGFVTFGDENERSRAITEMNGVCCLSRPMRISGPTRKKQSGNQEYSSQGALNLHTTQCDEKVWCWTSSGEYTVNSGYRAAERLEHSKKKPHRSNWASSISHSTSNEDLNAIWTLQVPPKVQRFWWKVLTNTVKTRVNLAKRKFGVSPLCPICKKDMETMEHIFFHCSWTGPVWFATGLLNFKETHRLQDIRTWFLAILNDVKAGITQQDYIGDFIFTCRSIWLARNKFLSNSGPPDSEAVVDEINVWRRHHIMADVAEKVKRDVKHSPQWSPPCGNNLKINVDASWKSKTKCGSLAAIVRDWTGNLIEGCVQTRVVTHSALAAELLAIRMAIDKLVMWSGVPIVIESDCKTAILLIEKKIPPDNKVDVIVKDIQMILMKLAKKNLSFIWIERDANKCSDWVARAAAGGNLALNWVECPPRVLVSLLQYDMLNSDDSNVSLAGLNLNPGVSSTNPALDVDPFVV